MSDWLEVFGEIFTKYRDGYLSISDADNPACGCSVTNSPYSNSWYERIVGESGQRYEIVNDISQPCDDSQGENGNNLMNQKRSSRTRRRSV